MDETLGKRIVSNRKRLGITQERLAEQLGITAQAVSKWENDQSCPDITMLPKLAEIFGITTDALLGITHPEQQKPPETKPVTENSDSSHKLEVHWDTERKNNIILAVWIMLTAGCLFVANRSDLDVSLWDILWTNGLITFGIFGIFKKFSFFWLGSTLLGAYFLLDKLNAMPDFFSRDLLLPVFLLLFGLSLLLNAICKPKKPTISITHNGEPGINSISGCNISDDSFDIECAFGEKNQIIELSEFRHGNVDLSFGNITLDLTAVEHFMQGCSLDADCAFGKLTILVPRNIIVELDKDSAFGSVDIQGNHDTNVISSIRIDADVSFGQINIKYI